MITIRFKTVLVKAVVILLLPVVLFASTIDLPRTGQTKCYSDWYPGEEINCTGTGQDGEMQAGIAWPSSRFDVQGNTYGYEVDIKRTALATGLSFLDNRDLFADSDYRLTSVNRDNFRTRLDCRATVQNEGCKRSLEASRWFSLVVINEEISARTRCP